MFPSLPPLRSASGPAYGIPFRSAPSQIHARLTSYTSRLIRGSAAASARVSVGLRWVSRSWPGKFVEELARAAEASGFASFLEGGA
jgi:hypothetical protein